MKRLLFLPVLLLSAALAADTPEVFRTVAEKTEFEATSSYDETLAYLQLLASTSAEVHLTDAGRSGEGRRIPVVVAARDNAFNPAAAERTGRPVILIQNGIHGGEIDGKDASLLLLRSLARGELAPLLEHVIVVVVAIYNVDGHERVSPYNRPNQNGPVRGMGFRTTTDGHDLNRDHLKLDTPEARAIVGLFNRWRPHLHIDNHVTDGSEHAWVLTYSWAEAPQTSAPVDAWLREHMPPVIENTRRAGHPLGPYVSLLDSTDPAKGFSTVVAEPRYATGYYPLRNRPSILVENHSYKPYRDRVLANLSFMTELLRRIAASPAELVDAVTRAEKETVERGAPDAGPSDVHITYEPAEGEETQRFPVYAWSSVPSTALGVPILRYERGNVRETEVPWIHRVDPELSLARPRGYLVLPGWPEIEKRIHGHGLRARRVATAAAVQGETLHISNPRQEPVSSPSYQGRTRIGVDVERRPGRFPAPVGSLWIPADQPDFEVAVQLFEPEAPDSLVSWGVLSSVLERKEYIDPRVLEPLVVEMLEDARTRAEWEQALQDETFAGDPWARWLWWYRRTPYWDETVGRLPVLRVLTTPDLDTYRWQGPR